MEFEIKGVKYRTAKLDVFQQLKVSRKLLPVLAGLVSDFGTLKSMMAGQRGQLWCRAGYRTAEDCRYAGSAA
jgi:hypothetical protein